MKIIRALVTVLMAAVMAITAASCMSKKAAFTESKYYVMVGTAGMYDNCVRLRYFDGDEIKSVVWYHSPADYEYGDVFVDRNGIEPTREISEEDMYANKPYSLGMNVKLEKLGNCKDLMDSKKMTVTSADYDGMGHWSIHLAGDWGKEYYYGFSNDAFFGVDLTGAHSGDTYTFAMNNGNVVIPLEKG